MAVVCFATASFATNKVQMTLTSPTIYKVGCEKIGSTTYSFDGGSQIVAGDWWYMDLPENVTLCKSYNYVITGFTAPGTPGTVRIFPNRIDWQTAAVFAGTTTPSMGAPLASNGDGPLTTSGTTPQLTAVGDMAFLVKGDIGTRRITIYALTATPTGGDSITTGSDATIQFKLFDGKSWSNLTNTIATSTRILLDTDNDGIYGEEDAIAPLNQTDEVIGGNFTVDAVLGVPYVENTLCSTNALMEGQYLFTSYASKSDKFTFSGDSQIAHTADRNVISLKACKGDVEGDIQITGGQNATTCTFDYEGAVFGDYCPTFGGNRFLIESSTGSFGDIDDKYTITAEITTPADGVYFTAAPALALIRSNEDECAVAGAAQVAAFTAYQGVTPVTQYAQTTCTVTTGRRVDKVVQTSASAFKTDGFDTIYVNFAPFAYDNNLVLAGEEVTVKITLDRYPCGTIFEGSRTIGTFVNICGTAAGTTTLLFPWLPGTDATGWWGGFVITNFGTAAGTATLTYRDADGGTATYTTPSIAANAQFNATSVTASMLTNVTGYDAAKNFSVSAVCQFAARGFAFIGNGTEGTGYAVD